jgi:hypothetical protein
VIHVSQRNESAFVNCAQLPNWPLPMRSYLELLGDQPRLMGGQAQVATTLESRHVLM